MKVKDMIAALTNCPMDDECKVQVEVEGLKFSADCDFPARVNADQNPHTVIVAALELNVRVENNVTVEAV